MWLRIKTYHGGRNWHPGQVVHCGDEAWARRLIQAGNAEETEAPPAVEEPAAAEVEEEEESHVDSDAER